MATNNHASKWRNFALWSAISATVCVLAALGITAFQHAGALDSLFRSKEVVTKSGLAVILASLCAGLSMRHKPISWRAIRNFLVLNVVAVMLVMLTMWGFGVINGAAAVDAMSVSEKAAATVGIALFIFALCIVFAVMAAYEGTRLMPEEDAEALRDSRREVLYGSILMATKGLMLVLLSLAGPDGMLSQVIVLAVAVVLLAINTVLTLAMWQLMDELSRTLTLESRNAAFYLIMVVGGGWAILAHLGFVAAPAPLDWLTMFVLIWFVASFIAVGRRGLLKR